MPFERAQGRLLRSFTLPGLDGKPVDTFRFRGSRPLIVLFHDGAACTPCADLLRGIAADAERFHAEGAQIISVSSGTGEADKALAQAIVPQVLTLFDPEGKAREAQGFGEPALVITDRHSEIFALWRSDEHQTLPGVEDVYGWLMWIEAQCDTCSNFSWKQVTAAND